MLATADLNVLFSASTRLAARPFNPAFPAFEKRGGPLLQLGRCHPVLPARCLLLRPTEAGWRQGSTVRFEIYEWGDPAETPLSPI